MSIIRNTKNFVTFSLARQMESLLCQEHHVAFNSITSLCSCCSFKLQLFFSLSLLLYIRSSISRRATLDFWEFRTSPSLICSPVYALKEKQKDGERTIFCLGNTQMFVDYLWGRPLCFIVSCLPRKSFALIHLDINIGQLTKEDASTDMINAHWTAIRTIAKKSQHPGLTALL